MSRLDRIESSLSEARSESSENADRIDAVASDVDRLRAKGAELQDEIKRMKTLLSEWTKYRDGFLTQTDVGKRFLASLENTGRNVKEEKRAHRRRDLR